MSEEMTDVVPTQDEENSSLWSSIESLAPLGEQLIQTPVGVSATVCTQSCIFMFHIFHQCYLFGVIGDV